MKAATYTKLFAITLITLLLSVSLLSFAVVRYAGEENANSFNSLVKFKFNIRGEKNDVVMIGDSALLMGVMPVELEKKYGIRAINLGLVGYCGPLVFNLLLDNYLRNNEPPKLIIFYFAASTPYFFEDSHYEKTYPFIRYASFSELTRHTGQVCISDVIAAASRISTDKFHGLWKKKPQTENSTELSAAKGFSANGSSVVLQRGSTVDSWKSKHLALEYLADVKHRYSTKRTRVVVYLAPMPEGEKSFRYFAERYQTVSDNQPFQLPNEYFVDAVHLNRRGAEYNTRLFGKFLRDRCGL